jgi:hypothetical protein
MKKKPDEKSHDAVPLIRKALSVAFLGKILREFNGNWA